MLDRMATHFVDGFAKALGWSAAALLACGAYYVVTGRNLLDVAVTTLQKCLM